MTDMHCTAVEAGRASCTCGWKSPQVSSPYGLEQMATWHRLSVDATIDNPLLTAYLAPVSEAERTSPAAKVVADNPLASEWMLHRVRRELLTAEYAWAIPTEPVLHRLAELSPICDLGCGTGYWASLLAKAGAEVLAVDALPPLGAENRWHRTEGKLFGRQATIRHFVDIVLGDAATFDVPSSHTLMLCWPPYDSSMAAEALARYRGDRVIYIGEGGSGCTADDAFHDALADQWSEVNVFEIPQWPGIHDAVYVYERAAGDHRTDRS